MLPIFQVVTNFCKIGRNLSHNYFYPTYTAQATGAKSAVRARGGHEVRERERRVRVGVELPLRVAHALVHEGLLRLLNNIE